MNRHLLFLILIAAAAFFVRIGDLGFWDPDEGRYAEIAREMVESGDYVVPHFNGMPYLDKPPLYYWLVAGSFTCFGFGEFAARLPNALLAVIGLFALYGLGRRMFGPTAGFRSAAILATSFLYMGIARVVVIDMLLTVCVLLALQSFYVGYDDTTKRRRMNFLFFLFMGMGFLAKGPVGVIIPAATVLLFLLVRGDLTYLRKVSSIAGLAVFTAVALPWYILIAREQPQFLRYFFLDQNLMGFVSGAVHHPKPWYMSVPLLLAGMFPWSLFVAALALSMPWRAMAGRIQNDPRVGFLVCWAAVAFLLFTVSSSKLMTYYLPVIPPLALLLVAGWEEADRIEDRRRLALVHWGFVALLIAVVAAAVVYVVDDNDLPRLLGIAGGREIGMLMAGLILMVVAVVGGMVLVIRSRAALAAGLLVTAALIMIQLVIPFAVGIGDYRCAREIAVRVSPSLHQEDAVVSFHAISNGFRYYTHHPIFILGKKGEYGAAIGFTDRPEMYSVTADRLWEMIASDRTVYVYCNRADRHLIPSDLQVRMSVVAEDRFHVVLVNRRDSS